jgi:transposase
MPTPLEIAQAKRIEELEKTIRDLIAYSQKLESRIVVLDQALRDQGKPPPPGDQPIPPPPQQRKKKKKRGRKKGHKGVSRCVPTRPDRIVDLVLETCPRCDTRLGKPCGHRDHIVEEFPLLIQLLAILYRHYQYWCPGCQCMVEAGPHPEEPKHGKLGLRALLFCADLKHRLGIPYRKIREVLASLGAISISSGAIQQGMIRLAAFFTATYMGLVEALRKAKAVYADETGWKMDGLRWWLWVFTNPELTVYQAAPTRGNVIPKTILGEDFDGTVIADFYSAYNSLPGKAQKCLAHFFRELKACAARGSPAFLVFRDRVTRLLKQAIALRSRREKMSETAFSRRVDTIRRRLGECRRGSSTDPDVERLKNRMSIFRGEFLTFLTETGVEPDNNRAERAIRPAVVARKISGGSRSVKGAEAHAILMSIIQTCRQQGTNIMDFGMSLLAARNAGKRDPELVRS